MFTQKFSAIRNYERLVELPTFGHSDNHAGLQHRYYDVKKGRHVGGVVVSDYLNQRSGALMVASENWRRNAKGLARLRLRPTRHVFPGPIER